jgi:hypothetical protein
VRQMSHLHGLDLSKSEKHPEPPVYSGMSVMITDRDGPPKHTGLVLDT